MWAVKLIEISLDLELYTYGIFPHKLNCLTGIITAPFIHGSYEHLISNTIPFLLLATALFYFYKEAAYKVFIFIWFFSGLWVWLAARPAYHIGASGMIYGFSSFLFFSGLLNRNRSLASLSLLVVFIYGGTVWGILPMKPEISWESHLFGAITGLILALIYAPKKAVTEDKIVKEEELLNDFSEPDCSDEFYTEISYHLSDKKKD